MHVAEIRLLRRNNVVNICIYLKLLKRREVIDWDILKGRDSKKGLKKEGLEN